MEYPILRYPDPTQGYVLYTDASGIGWSGVLTQEHTDDKGKSKHHPICYVSGQFRGSQLNWAALMIEAYAIYMAIKRLSFYVTDADITIRSDHLPLKKFLNKQTMNSKGIPGAQNLLADSLSCLIDVVSDTQQPDEPKDYEFGSYCFEELEPAKVFEKISTEVIEAQEVSSEGVECLLKSWESPEIDGVVLKYEETPLEKQQPHDAYSESSEPSQNLRISPEIGTFQFNYEEKPLKKRTLLDSSESSEFSHNSRKDTCIKITEHEDVREITLPLKPKQLQQLQKNDTYCRDIAKKLHKDMELQKIFIKENGVLYRLWTEDGRTFKCILVPQFCKTPWSF